MPSVRTEVRNVYGLGTPELYRDADKEDPKAVLDGVAVAGLVGILRQLGDLAEFAAEVFHGLQEHIMITSSRSNKLVVRVQKIEAALPPLEKSILAQRSHLHFAYTAGSNWHARIRSEQNHFIYNDLPRFIMDSYEECRGPPRLQLLDKFDTGGPGSCLKRYSDPTFFKRTSLGSDEEYIKNVIKGKKSRKTKKKRSWRRNAEVSRSASMPNYGSRTQFSSRNLDRRPSLVQSFSRYDPTQKSDFDSGHGSDQMECVSQPSYSNHPEDEKSKDSVSSPPKMQHNQSFDYSFLEEKSDHAYNDVGHDLSQELTDLVSTSTAWDFKMQPGTQESKGSFDLMSQLHLNNMLDHAFPDERVEIVYDDGGNGVSEEKAGHCTSSVTWNAKTEHEKESRESFSSPTQIYHGALLDCALPDRKGDGEYSDIGNSLTEEQNGHNLSSVAWNAKKRTAVEPKEVFYSPLQMNPTASIEDASPDEKSRESFSSSTQIYHGALLDCALPDRKGDGVYSDIGNSLTEEQNGHNLSSLTEEQNGHNLSSVAWTAKKRTAVEPKEVFYSPLQMNPTAFIEDTSPDEKLWVISDEEINSSMSQQIVPSSPFLTSTANTEQLDPTIKKYVHDESLETHQENLVVDTQVSDFDTSETVEQRGSEPEAEIIPRSISYESHFDDIESETDNFMDALNTIESESETDLDFQRKRAVELESSLKMDALNTVESESETDLDFQRKRAVELESSLKTESALIRAEFSDWNSSSTPEVTNKNSLKSSGFGGNTDIASGDCDPGSISCSDKVNCEDIPETLSSGFGDFSSSPQIARITSTPDSSLCVDSSERSNNLEASKVEPLVSNHIISSPRNPGLGLPVVTKIQCGPSDSEKPPPQLLGTPSVKFWTNGGLLGLQPSKPPDGVINTVSQPFEANQNEVVTSRRDSIPISEKHAGKHDNRQNKTRDDYTNSGQVSGFSIKNIASRFSAKDLDVKLEKSSTLYQQSFTDKPLQECLNGSGIMSSQTTGLVNPESHATGAGQVNGKNSSRILELGNRLLTNGFHGKVSHGWNENTDSVSSMNTGSNETKNDYQHVLGRTFSSRIKDFPGSGSPFTSPSSSPPLGHMKISFRPIDGIDNSKLKLRFPDRNNIQESNRDTFPSFQLVPETLIPLQEGSDSDDDTFSRSSPSPSDDYISHQSESNSEHWETGNSLNQKDQEVYDALHRISLTESTSTSLENDRTAQQEVGTCSGRHIPFAEYSLEDSQTDNLFDLPVLDTQHSSFKYGVRTGFPARDLLEPLSSTESTPPPPPFPPMEWRSTQSHLDAERDDLHIFSENRHAFDFKEPGSTISHQPKPPPVEQHQVIGAALTLKSKMQQPDVVDITGQRLADHADNVRGINEKEDFLHQIRAKSFNLRRTVPAKPTGTTGSTPANVKVTAILEKANAIRQAVGSDEGEDNWSDT